MLVGACLYSSPPFRYVGGEIMTYQLLRWAKDAGHEVVVFGKAFKHHHEYNGIKILSGFSNNLQLRRTLFKSDIIVSHPELYRHIAGWPGKRIGIVHNLNLTTLRGLDEGKWDIVVANSDSTAAELRGRTVDINTIIYPPTHAYPKLSDGGECVLMSNVSKEKGVDLFYELAKRLPDINFIGAIGGYGEQIQKSLPNVNVVGHGPLAVPMNLARVVISPSRSETYGMTIAEATQSGIPVIASDIPAHRDVLGPEGNFLDVDDIDAWARKVKSMFNDSTYSKEVAKAKRRGKVLDNRTAIAKQTWLDLLV